MTLLWIALGAGIASMLRFAVMTWWPPHFQYFTAVFAVNIIGAFILGIVITQVYASFWREVLITGFLGGFTTFSTMMTQSAQKRLRRQIGYLLLQTICGCFSLALGLLFSHFILR